MKVLMSAFLCRPEDGSEPGAGWAWARAAAARHDVWLLTHSENEAGIREVLGRHASLSLTPVYIDRPRLARDGLLGGPYSYRRYLAWQREAARVARRLHARERFDVAHHITLGADWLPAGVAWIGSLPMVWGPVGGATGTVPRLWRYLGWRSAGFEIARGVVSAAARRVAGDATARRAGLVLAQNSDVARRFRRFGWVVTEPHVALSGVGGPSREDPRGDGRRRAMFVGRLLGWKGPRLAIAALAHPAASGWCLDLLGDGPDAAACEALVERLGLGDRVRLRGLVPRQVVLEELRTAGCLVLPSLHDSAGWVVAEALAFGVPVVCFDRGGPGFLVGEGQGRKLSVKGDVIAHLAEALCDLPGRFPPERRWDADRLPELLDGWYRSLLEVARHSTTDHG